MARCTPSKAGNLGDRTADTELDTHTCNHTVRGNRHHDVSELSKARDMAGLASIRTTQLYDRRSRAVKIDDVVLINLRVKPKE